MIKSVVDFPTTISFNRRLILLFTRLIKSITDLSIIISSNQRLTAGLFINLNRPPIFQLRFPLINDWRLILFVESVVDVSTINRSIKRKSFNRSVTYSTDWSFFDSSTRHSLRPSVLQTISFRLSGPLYTYALQSGFATSHEINRKPSLEHVRNEEATPNSRKQWILGCLSVWLREFQRRVTLCTTIVIWSNTFHV